MARKLFLFLAFACTLSFVFSQSIEKKRIKLPFPHKGVGRAVQYSVEHPDVPEAFRGFRIAFVSDIHYASKFKQKHIAALTRTLRFLKPDLVLLGGDYQEGCDYVEELFDSLASVSAPYGMAAVMGNNDYERCHGLIVESMQKHGIVPLEHKVLPVEKDGKQIYIAGVRNPFDLKNNGVSPAQSCDSAAYVILLTHTPDYAQTVDNSRADLALAGHTHGGQVAFFGYAPVTASQYGQRFVRGLSHTDQEVPVITTNGIGTSRWKVRIGARSEVLLIELVPAQGSDKGKSRKIKD